MERRHAGHGMDMGGDMGGDAVMSMMGIFHTKLGIDDLWFSGWIPTSSGVTFATALGLFFLAVLTRLLSVIKTQVAIAGRQAALRKRRDAENRRMERLREESAASSGVYGSNEGINQRRSTPNNFNAPLPPRAVLNRSGLPPFSFSQDFPRGVLEFFHAGAQYFLMLAVMTANVWYFIAIIGGLGVGEMAFGRFGDYHGGEEESGRS